MLARAVLDVALPVFVISAVGWVIAGWRRFDLRGVTDILLYVAIPALLVHSLLSHRPRPHDVAVVAAVALVVMAGTGVAAMLLARLLGLPRRGVLLASVFMNAGNFGLPLALLAWGESGLGLAVLYYLTASIAQNTLGIWVARGGAAGWREMFRLPLPYAAAIGILLAWLGVRLPPAVALPLEMLGTAAIPLMLLSLGFTLRHIRLGAVGPALVAGSVRMGGGLLIALGMVELLGLGGLVAKIVILTSALPSAVLNVVFAQRYAADPEVTASAILLTTGLSLVTVPLVVAWLG